MKSCRGPSKEATSDGALEAPEEEKKEEARSEESLRPPTSERECRVETNVLYVRGRCCTLPTVGRAAGG